MVKEGIDMAPVIVRANSGGYTTNSHKFMVRTFAKAKGSNRVVEVSLTGLASVSLFEAGGPTEFFHQKTYEEGWGVYKKSLSPTIKFSQTAWVTSPKKVCEQNLEAQMDGGKSKSNVLSREWKLTANALFSFRAAVDTKAKAKKGTFGPGSEEAAAALLYPVNVVCRAAG
jgi:hypothetical protein